MFWTEAYATSRRRGAVFYVMGNSPNLGHGPLLVTADSQSSRSKAIAKVAFCGKELPRTIFNCCHCCRHPLDYKIWGDPYV